MNPLELLLVGNCPFRKGDRVWTIEFGNLFSGIVIDVAEWVMSNGLPPVPFIHVEYDFKGPFGRSEAHFWREDDLKKLHRQHAQSSCCMAGIRNPDKFMQGYCEDCGEMASPLEPDEMVEKKTYKLNPIPASA